MPVPSANVLVVDDDPAVGKVLEALLGQAGIACQHVLGAKRAIEVLNERPVDVVVTDLRMPAMNGVELLDEVVERWPEIPVILMTAHGTIEVAVEAMKKGAADFVLKPFDRAEILFTISKQITASRYDDRPPAPKVKGGAIQSAAPKMREVEDMIRRAANGSFTVLIRGENGTGKDVAAQAIHKAGPRRDGPFVRVQCAAFPDTLIEGELFGWEKGAHNMATARRPGRVDLAEGGTLFLDEIGDVKPAVQVKLLRLLQEREFERLGSNQTLKSTARFIAATHQPLEELIKKELFREDLFWRLNVLPIWIPPLRERTEDIETLAVRFCREAGAANGRGELELSAQAVALLERQPWPGNVRQLQNFMERLVVMSDGARLTAADVQRELERQAPIGSLADDPRSGREGDVPSGTLQASRREAEREAIVTALERSANNKSLAARLLNISRRTLYYKLEDHGLL